MYLKKETFQLNDLVSEVAESLSSVHQTHQIELLLDRNISVRGDRTRINQVLVNLITNGIKYSPSSDKLLVQTAIMDDVVTVYVKDSGIGISESEIKNLFSRFYRVSSVRESYQGLGLGLYISNQIIEQHHGKMGVESEEDKGSVFWFRLPLCLTDD
jgi:signal transduction histidine kinase